MKKPHATKLIGLLFLSVMFGCSSCSEKSDEASQNIIKTSDPIEGIRIAWDYSSMQRIAPQDGRSLSWAGYPRVHSLQDGTHLVTYETEGNVEIVRSTDNGATWTKPLVVFAKHTRTNAEGLSTAVNMSNGELIELADGTLLSACNYRPVEAGIVPYSIAVKRSSDKGKTWSEAQIVYEAGTTFNDGCWEPAFLQLPSGEVQIYFANEGPYTQSDEQNITMLRSEDQGQTWSEDEVTVCFRAQHRDGMPVPLLLNDEIVVAIEDNLSGQFKPYTVRTSLDDNWKQPVLADSEQRQSALKKAYADQVYAGAPYLIKGSQECTLLSYQTTINRGADWERSTMEVAIGDANARNFEKQTCPFNVPLDKEAKWNALAMWDENTVVAASSTSFNSSGCEVWIIKGHLIPDLVAYSSEVEVDGIIEEGEWNLPIFVGHTSVNQVQAGVQYDETNLILAARLKLAKDEVNQPAEAHILIDPNNYCTTQLEDGLCKWTFNTNGQASLYKWDNGKWKEEEMLGEWKFTNAGTDTYEVELKIPFEQLGWEEMPLFRINVGMTYQNKNGEKTEEWISNSTAQESYTWCSVRNR